MTTYYTIETAVEGTKTGFRAVWQPTSAGECCVSIALMGGNAGGAKVAK